VNPATAILVRENLKRAEGLRLKPYRCPAGKLTVGYGRNLEDNGIAPSEAVYLLENDIVGAAGQVERYLPWTARLDSIRQAAVIELAFNLGIAGLLKFHATLMALHEGRYADAARHLLDSKWAGQVGPTRAGRVARMIEVGDDADPEAA
jgi:lysozyme